MIRCFQYAWLSEFAWHERHGVPVEPGPMIGVAGVMIEMHFFFHFASTVSHQYALRTVS